MTRFVWMGFVCSIHARNGVFNKLLHVRFKADLIQQFIGKFTAA